MIAVILYFFFNSFIYATSKRSVAVMPLSIASILAFFHNSEYAFIDVGSLLTILPLYHKRYLTLVVIVIAYPAYKHNGMMV